MKKIFLIVGIIIAVGASVALRAASSNSSSSSSLKKNTLDSANIIKVITPKKTTPAKESEKESEKESTKESTKESGKTTEAKSPSVTPIDSLKTPVIITAPKETKETKETQENTDILKPNISTPLEKITPLSPETKQAIILPLKETTDTIQKLKDITPIKEIPLKDIPLAPVVEKTKENKETPSLEFLLTPPSKNAISLPENILLIPKEPENTIILEKITPDKNDSQEIKLPLTQLTPAAALFKDVSESSASYQAIKNIVELMDKYGNYALPESKKFRPRNKVQLGFASQIAVSLAGESCGTSKGINKQKACLLKAMKLGFVENGAAGNKPITRGDFYDLVLHALKIPAKEPADGLFCTDVDASNTYANIIATAKHYGIARRYTKKGEGGYCLPNVPLTKADAAVIASKALEAKNNLQKE
ncbi:hypothetical protein HYW83_06755 [Candidatus Peregrinibacteria bacterium]|nr:hypothetical protein [Candidatus Peregrinibacteria bacterium]